MIDQKLLRQSAEEVADNLARRGHEFDADAYLALDEQRKTLQVDTEGLRNERNTSAKKIGKAEDFMNAGASEIAVNNNYTPTSLGNSDCHVRHDG